MLPQPKSLLAAPVVLAWLCIPGPLTAEEASEYDVARSTRDNNFDPLVDAAAPDAFYSPPASGPYGSTGWIEPQNESPWLHLGLYGNAFYWLYGGPQYFSPPPAGPPPPGAKPGMFQRLTVTETWLAADGDRGMGVSETQVKAVLAAPLPWSDGPPLLITPGFGANYFDGPTVSDVPAHTYDTWLDVRWMRQLSPRVGVDLAVTPGWYSDYEQSSSDALRIGARAALAITCTPTLTVVGGAAYLDRDDVPVVPIAGVIWIPSDDWKLELLPPRPKIARRLAYDCNASTWVYVAGEFGGGSWAIERQTGAEDVMNYRDYRAMLGIERNRLVGLSARIEGGYVFGREIEYDSGTPDVELDDTALVRIELSY
jgi:hypothetical protein